MRAPHDVFGQAATLVQGRDAAQPPAGVFVLTVTQGPDLGASVAVDGSQASRILVGQSEACHVRLTDALVSRRHMALEPTSIGLKVTDLGSTNGTFVDRVRIREAVLQGDEVVRVGSTVFNVDLRDAVSPVAGLPEADRFGRLLGASPVMRRLYPLCARLAATNVAVVIEGETGTGKEVLAESLHEEGPRARRPFVVFDCTAVPPNLAESELFGHERGSFTGALGEREGVFEQADGGTLFIDEIGDLDSALQPKLLRAIDRGEVRRVGAARWRKVDVRVLAATRRDLDQEVQAGRFRDDLFHRLAVGRIELPPLRTRCDDLPLLVRHFCEPLGADAEALLAACLDRWSAYDWPGNLRELRNAVVRRVMLGDVLTTDAVSSNAASAAVSDGSIERVLDLPFARARDQLMTEFERRYVEHLLAQHGGDVARAALAAGIGRRYFQMLRARGTR